MLVRQTAYVLENIHQQGYQSMWEVTDHLQELEKYADLVIPRIFSTKISKSQIFHGRDPEFRELDQFLEDQMMISI